QKDARFRTFLQTFLIVFWLYPSTKDRTQCMRDSMESGFLIYKLEFVLQSRSGNHK
ncbi:Hypothetical protein FKW44_013190, partial [Caligus rogercresseyi]